MSVRQLRALDAPAPLVVVGLGVEGSVATMALPLPDPPHPDPLHEGGGTHLIPSVAVA